MCFDCYVTSAHANYSSGSNQKFQVAILKFSVLGRQLFLNICGSFSVKKLSVCINIFSSRASMVFKFWGYLKTTKTYPVECSIGWVSCIHPCSSLSPWASKRNKRGSGAALVTQKFIILQSSKLCRPAEHLFEL